MKAWLLDRMGDGIEKVHLGEVPDPKPGPGQVVIDLHFAGLNPADRYLAENLYPAKPASFPHIVGRDGMGLISALGNGVTNFKLGQKVIVVFGQAGINQPGTFAEKLLAPAESIGPIPNGWTDHQACAAPLVYETAYQAISQWNDLPEKSIVLITGATGGVGVASVHLAKSLGFMVIGLSRSAEKSARLRELGVDMTFDPNDPNWKKSLKDHLGKARVNLAIDNIGGALFADVIDVMGAHGRISCVGRLAGPVPEFNTATLFFRRLRIGGVNVHGYTTEEAQHAWREVQTILSKTGARPSIDSVHPFENLQDAFEALRRGPMGKVILRIK
jgi:NADPH:quinone reductase